MNRGDLPRLRGYLQSTAKRPLSGVPRNSMRTVFSDEAGVGDEKAEPILVVAAVVIDGDHQWSPMEAVAQTILEKYVPEANRATFEFKANRLFGQLSKENNENILRELLQIINTFQLPIAWAAIDRAGMQNDYAAKEVITCPKELMQNLAFLVAATQVEGLMRCLWPNERAIWLADETRANQMMKASLREYQRETPFGEWKRFERIIDTVFFGSSHASLGIQLADACNFFIKRHHMKDASAERFFQMIYPLMIERDEPVLYSAADKPSAP